MSIGLMVRIPSYADKISRATRVRYFVITTNRDFCNVSGMKLKTLPNAKFSSLMNDYINVRDMCSRFKISNVLPEPFVISILRPTFLFPSLVQEVHFSDKR